MSSAIIEVVSNPIQIEVTGQPDVILEVQQRSVEVVTIAAQGMGGAKGDKGEKGDAGAVAATLPASNITDLDDFIASETEPGNLVLWFENQLL